MSSNVLDSKFDEVMKQVGFQGKFQTRFVIIFNIIMNIIGAWSYSNLIMALAVPDHWCHVPGRDSTNYTSEEWKNLTIPLEFDVKGKESFSKCKMYNITDYEQITSTKQRFDNSIVECQHGWDFDRTWYKETAPTEGEWVCDKELLATNALALTKIGDVIGTLTFGHLGDIIGRKPVFFIAALLIFIGRTIAIFNVHNYTIFLFSSLVGCLTMTTLNQAPLIIALEISEESKRTQIAMLQFTAGTVGFAIMPLIFWVFGHWFHFMITTTTPCILVFLLYNLMVESPRWLAGQGKIDQCVKELKKIAKVNGTTVPEETYDLLKNNSEQREKTYGVMSLFSNWRLAKNTILIIINWVAGALVYHVILLNINSLAGNPFLNFFYLGIVELPTYVLAQYFSDRIGRRWVQVIPYLMSTLGFIIMTFLINNDDLQYLVVIISAAVKMLIEFIFSPTSIQTLEIYPTCVRQTGSSLASISASITGVIGPYIVYLGTSYDARYPSIILIFVCIAGAISTAFLPETLNEKLPETLNDAQVFGSDQKFWSWPKKIISKTKNMEMLNL